MNYPATAISAIQSSQKVLVVGYPAAGKTTLANALTALCPTHTVIHSDENYAFDNGASEIALLDLVLMSGEGKGFIFEGVLASRVLRKCAEFQGEWLPDLIVEVKCSAAEIARRYALERPDKKAKSIPPFCKALDTIMLAWKESEFSKSVPVVVVETD